MTVTNGLRTAHGRTPSNRLTSNEQKVEKDDIPVNGQMWCYEIIVDHYFPQEQGILAINPTTMRYAVPREAIFHALRATGLTCAMQS